MYELLSSYIFPLITFVIGSIIGFVSGKKLQDRGRLISEVYSPMFREINECFDKLDRQEFLGNSGSSFLVEPSEKNFQVFYGLKKRGLLYSIPDKIIEKVFILYEDFIGYNRRLGAARWMISHKIEVLERCNSSKQKWKSITIPVFNLLVEDYSPEKIDSVDAINLTYPGRDFHRKSFPIFSSNIDKPLSGFLKDFKKELFETNHIAGYIEHRKKILDSMEYEDLKKELKNRVNDPHPLSDYIMFWK